MSNLRNVGALLLSLLLLSAIRAAPSGDKPAVLILTPSISIGEQIEGFVEFRWDNEAPVKLNTWTINGELSTLTNLSVFDEAGKKVNWVVPISLPIAPDGVKTVSRGEQLKLRVYLIGRADFEHPGHYYAIGDFSWAESAGEPVKFVTTKFWFEVTDAKPNTT